MLISGMGYVGEMVVVLLKNCLTSLRLKDVSFQKDRSILWPSDNQTAKS